MIDNEFIDLTATTEISAGKQDIAMQIILLFLEELPEFKQSLIAASAQNERDEIGRIIHKMLGACAICIAPRIKSKLDSLSAAYEANEPCLQTQLTALNDAIEDTLKFCAQNQLGSIS